MKIRTNTIPQPKYDFDEKVECMGVKGNIQHRKYIKYWEYFILTDKIENSFWAHEDWIK